MDILDFDRTRDAQALRKFAAVVWDRTTADAYWQWWLSCPSLDGVVAYGEDGHLLAVLFGIRRPYLFGDQSHDCLEPFDWFSRPEVIGSAIGLFLMRRLQKRGFPVVVLGANAVAEKVMRVLGFRDVADGRTYWLPFASRPLRERGRGPLSAHAFALAGQAFRARWRRARPAGAALRLVNGVPSRAASPPPDGVSPTPNPALLRWWREATSDVGVFLPFQVDVNGQPAIWALVRLAGPDVSRRGWLLEWHDYTGDPSVSEWALTSILQAVVRMGSRSIHIMTTDPRLHRQLEKRQFRTEGRPVALISLPKDGPNVVVPVRLMGSLADNSYLPLV